jgi:flagellar motor switch/type III secretory pathway protein FliN
MTCAVRRWLPIEAISHNALEGAVNLQLNLWASTWSVSPPRFSPESTGQHDVGTADMSVASEGVKIRFDSISALGCGILAAGLNFDPTSPFTAADRGVLEKLGEEMLADLAQSCAGEQVSTPVSDETINEHHFAFSCRRPDIRLEIDLSVDAGINLRNTQTRDTNAVAPKEGLREALASQQVSVGMLVGQRRLPLHSLRDLAVGDTLVLDASVDAAMPLVVDGRRLHFGSGRISVTGEAVAIVVNQPVGRPN